MYTRPPLTHHRWCAWFATARISSVPVSCQSPVKCARITISYTTIVHTCAPSYLHATASSSGAAASAAEDRKRAKYLSLGDGICFDPFALETLGPFGPSARSVLSVIAARIAARTGEKGVLARLNRQFAAAVQLGIAACVLEAHGQPRG